MLMRKNSAVILLLIFIFGILGKAIASDIEKGNQLYEQGKYNEALPLIKKGAVSGDAEAQFNLGRMYSKGHGIKQNLEQAMYWYKKSADQGHLKATYNLAYMYSHGKGVKENPEKAYKLYLESAEKGLPAAQFNLALMYFKGKGVKKDNQKAFEWFYKAALQGDKEAQFNVALSYTEGNGIKQDYAKALYWYKKAAEQGYAKAMSALGIVYRQGEGVPANRDEAIKWYKKAAAQGYAPAMANLGSLYYPEDASDLESWDEAYKWYSMAIDHGDRKNAPLGLGLIHLFGSGRYPVDNAKAYSLFALAAENGRADGWYWLGVMEEYGFGRPQNEEKAMELYKKAAESGVEPAINRLEHGHQDWSLHLFKAIRPLFATPYY